MGELCSSMYREPQTSPTDVYSPGATTAPVPSSPTIPGSGMMARRSSTVGVVKDS
jgi:hypothetical protein